tara:strand:+ start:483 stop:1328 length:846 start_codon:yes stop_codon:yes gene_type:complete
MSLEKRGEHLCYGGKIGLYTHASRETACDMRFAVFTPAQAEHAPVPALYYLAGLTCNEETFLIKAGAIAHAAEHGLMLVACDTSPRGLDIPGDSDAWDFGVGAGFYLDATAAPWSAHYRMGSYVNQELPDLIEQHFPADRNARGIFGHSMGGHGALVTALRNPQRWNSVSAFAPISNPAAVPWGEKAFGNYLGADRSSWTNWDASELMKKAAHPTEILVDQGLSDQFLKEQLHPQALRSAAETSGQKLNLREHAGYDHSYWFIQSFIADHMAHHALNLRRP